MKGIYTLFGRGREEHALVKSAQPQTYRIITYYPLGVTTRMGKILAADFSGGPMLIVGDSLEPGVTIAEIFTTDKGVFVKLIEQ